MGVEGGVQLRTGGQAGSIPAGATGMEGAGEEEGE